MPTYTVARSLDCRNQMYPVPILKAEQALVEMSPGQTLEVLATDANTKPDLAKWSERANSELLEVVEDGDGQFRFYVRKSSAQAPQKAADKKDENLFLVVLRTGLNQPGQIRAAFMYASLAAAMGQDTVVYCVQEGADAAKRDVPQKDTSPPGAPTITQRIEEALDMGILNYIYEPASFWEETLAFARQFCPPNKASMAVGRIKLATRAALETGIHEGILIEHETLQQLYTSKDAREGISAFLQKRQAKYEGK